MSIPESSFAAAAPGGLRVAFADDAAALVRFGFGAGGDVLVPCPRLAGPDAPEAWGAPPGGNFALVSIEVEDDGRDLAAAGAEAYRRLLGVVRPSPHPWLLRIWNYFDRINVGAGDTERYRRFCVGRAAAADAYFNAPPPAATAIGTPQAGGRVLVVALCTRTPAQALENPRQTPAWQYPRDYGPVSPGFSRGALVGDGDAMRLLASGTASIVGHVTRHVGDTAAQARETLLNLQALLDEGTRVGGRRFTLAGAEAVRVYLRSPADLEAARGVLETQLDPARVVYLHGDICREELRIELEGVFAPEP
jgi:chorismate lyase/3-hydroxybenzoate synthase